MTACCHQMSAYHRVHSGRFKQEQLLPSVLPFVKYTWIPTLLVLVDSVESNIGLCIGPIPLSLGRVSRFGKDPVHTASEEVDRKSGICKTFILKTCMYVRGKSTQQIRMMHEKPGRKNSFCFTAWIKSVKLWK